MDRTSLFFNNKTKVVYRLNFLGGFNNKTKLLINGILHFFHNKTEQKSENNGQLSKYFI